MAKQLNRDSSAWLKLIAESVNGIQYGSVQIVIHDGRIVQIERTEKRRFDGSSNMQGSLPSK